MTSAIAAVPALSKPAPSLWEKFAVPSQGIQKIISVVSKILTSIATFLAKEAPAALERFADVFKSCSVVLGLFDLIGSIKYWICDHSLKSIWQKTVVKVTTMAIAVLDTLLFFRHLKVFDMSRVCGKLGGIAIFSGIFSVVCLLHSTFSTWYDGIRVRETVAKVRGVEKEIAKLNEEKKAASDGPQKTQLDNRLKELDKELKDAKTERTKSWISLAGSIAKLVFAIIILAGLIAGVGVLAYSGGPMLAVGGALGAYSLFKYIYEQCHPTKK